MTAITLNLSPELEQKLRIEAEKAGVDPDRYIVNTLQERLQSSTSYSQILDGAAKSQQGERSDILNE